MNQNQSQSSTSPDFKIETGRFSKGLKKQIAKQQEKEKHWISQNAKYSKDLSKVANTGSGGLDVIDLSHKSSAKFVSLIANKVTHKPANLNQQMIQDTKDAFNTEALSKRQKLTVDTGFKSMGKYAGQQGSMSPTSTQNVQQLFTLFANKNPDNLRYEPASVNRSISEFPHYNIDSGDLTPRSKKQQQMAQSFSTQFMPDLSTDEKRLTKAYQGAQSAVQDPSKNLKTANDFASYRKTFNQ